jgi:hypothetical protein
MCFTLPDFTAKAGFLSSQSESTQNRKKARMCSSLFCAVIGA